MSAKIAGYFVILQYVDMYMYYNTVHLGDMYIVPVQRYQKCQIQTEMGAKKGKNRNLHSHTYG